MSISSTRGGGAHGHLTLTVSDLQYLAIAGIAFDVPAHPGAAPAHAAAATVTQITETNRAYTASLKEFNVYVAVQANANPSCP
jgi:hypothetical protein